MLYLILDRRFEVDQSIEAPALGPPECDSIAVYINASLYTISIHHSKIFVSVMKQTMMGMLLHFLSVLVGVLTVLDLIQGQDQSGLVMYIVAFMSHSFY
jgi:hypothetical protein